MARKSEKLDPGRVEINKTKVSTRRSADGMFLFHAPSARVVTLDPAGQKLWSKIEDGTVDISTLVAEHQAETGVTPEAAAFRVLSFLDVLRAEDFVRFSLPRDTEDAPLLDVTLDIPTSLEFQPSSNIFEASPDVADAISRGEMTTLRVARHTLTLAELKEMAAEAVGAELGAVLQLKALDLEPVEVSNATLLRIAAGRPTDDTAKDRRFIQLDSPSLEMSLGDLEEIRRKSTGSMVKRLARRIIVVVIIIGDIIVIVIIADGPGPTFGKSRNACKTVCV